MLLSPPLHTAAAAAALQRDLGNDAVVKRCVAEAVLQELCQEKEPEVRELQEGNHEKKRSR